YWNPVSNCEVDISVKQEFPGYLFLNWILPAISSGARVLVTPDRDSDGDDEGYWSEHGYLTDIFLSPIDSGQYKGETFSSFYTYTLAGGILLDQHTSRACIQVKPKNADGSVTLEYKMVYADGPCNQDGDHGTVTLTPLH